jgi:hypothetical protein
LSSNAAGNREQGITENLFPLDAPEPIVCFRQNGGVFRHIFRRLTAADHQVFYDNIEVVAEDRAAAGRPEGARTDTACFILYARAIQRVEGYRTKDGRELAEELSCRPDCVPQDHRLLAVSLLLKNRGSALMDTGRVAPNGKSVSFVVARQEGEPSLTTQDYGVLHHFRAPAPEHVREFLRAMKGGPPAHAILVQLYDELVERVQGYSVFGRELRGREEITAEMHAFHKEVAVMVLFSVVVDPDSETLTRRTAALPVASIGSKTPAPAPRIEMN